MKKWCYLCLILLCFVVKPVNAGQTQKVEYLEEYFATPDSYLMKVNEIDVSNIGNGWFLTLFQIDVSGVCATNEIKMLRVEVYNTDGE